MLVQLPTKLATRTGLSAVDMREVNDLWRAFDGERELGCFSPDELAALVPTAQDDIVAVNDRHARDRAAGRGVTNSRARAVHYGRRIA